MTQDTPSLATFEREVASRRAGEAMSEAFRLLRSIDEGMGDIGGIDFGFPIVDWDMRDLHVHFATRFAAALGDLITLADIQFDDAVTELLFIFHRWIDMLFRISGFRTSAFLLPRVMPGDGRGWMGGRTAMIKFLLVFSPSAPMTIQIEDCLRASPSITAIALLGYLSARSCISSKAGSFREQVLEWLPGRLEDVTLGSIRLSCAADVYMHCSYASGPGKHRIKADLIAQMRKVCLAAGASDMAEPPPPRVRPRIVVVAEHFRAGHSVFRTHSRAVRSLRERFEVIGLGYGERTDEAARACFDEMIFYPPGDLISSVRETADQILARQPDIVFHLGVGMANHVIALASLRLAPIQCVSYGHTATTMSPVIDYMILPDDFVGSEDRFVEKVLRLPPEAIPYAPPAASEPVAPPRRSPASQTGLLRIGVPASIMKLNAAFLAALAQIDARAKRKVEFAFFPLGAVGLSHTDLDQEIRRFLPGAIVHTETPRTIYLERLGECDFFLCPFPYGNMNSIIDAIIVGLPGVCLDGEEAHAHADVAIFRRLGLPEELAAARLKDYIAAALRLIDDADWRAECRRIASHIDLDQRFYHGDERLFCEAMYGLLDREFEDELLPPVGRPALQGLPSPTVFAP